MDYRQDFGLDYRQDCVLDFGRDYRQDCGLDFEWDFDKTVDWIVNWTVDLTMDQTVDRTRAWTVHWRWNWVWTIAAQSSLTVAAEPELREELPLEMLLNQMGPTQKRDVKVKHTRHTQRRKKEGRRIKDGRKKNGNTT